MQGPGTRKGDYDMGVIHAILWGGCVSARKSHSFYTRIASSRRDEAIRPLESSQLSQALDETKPSVPWSAVNSHSVKKPALAERETMTPDLEMSVRVRSQRFPSWQVYLRIGFVSLMFEENF